MRTPTVIRADVSRTLRRFKRLKSYVGRNLLADDGIRSHHTSCRGSCGPKDALRAGTMSHVGQWASGVSLDARYDQVRGTTAALRLLLGRGGA